MYLILPYAPGGKISCCIMTVPVYFLFFLFDNKNLQTSAQALSKETTSIRTKSPTKQDLMGPIGERIGCFGSPDMPTTSVFQAGNSHFRLDFARPTSLGLGANHPKPRLMDQALNYFCTKEFASCSANP